MKFSIFGLASVDVRPLPGAWVAELLSVVLGVQDHKKINFQWSVYFPMALKGLKGVQDIFMIEKYGKSVSTHYFLLKVPEEKLFNLNFLP